MNPRFEIAFCLIPRVCETSNRWVWGKAIRSVYEYPYYDGWDHWTMEDVRWYHIDEKDTLIKKGLLNGNF